MWTFPLRRKSDALATLTAFYSYVTTQFGRPILALQTENGKEFDNIAVRNLLASHVTIFRLTRPTRLSRMVAPSASFARLTTVSARCSSTPTCLLGSGRTRSQPPAYSLTFVPVVLAGTTPLTSSSSVRFHLKMAFASLSVSVILAPCHCSSQTRSPVASVYLPWLSSQHQRLPVL